MAEGVGPVVAAAVPDRIRWVVELLELQPRDRVLEVGCGPGVAAALVADRLTDGHLTAIDRSATAITRARSRLEGHVGSGRVVLEQLALAQVVDVEPYDKVFAVDVNVFWTTPADAECDALRRVLAPDGTVVLVFSGPAGTGRDVTQGVSAALGRHGFDPVVRRRPGAPLVAVTARRGP